MSEPSIANQLVRLFTEFPCAGTSDPDFELHMPCEVSEASYHLIVNHIEFRRRCMNQGFDNLLELLQMHRDALRKVEDIVAKKAAAEGGAEFNDHARAAAEYICNNWLEMPEYRKHHDANPDQSFSWAKETAVAEIVERAVKAAVAELERQLALERQQAIETVERLRQRAEAVERERDECRNAISLGDAMLGVAKPESPAWYVGLNSLLQEKLKAVQQQLAELRVAICEPGNASCIVSAIRGLAQGVPFVDINTWARRVLPPLEAALAATGPRQPASGGQPPDLGPEPEGNPFHPPAMAFDHCDDEANDCTGCAGDGKGDCGAVMRPATAAAEVPIATTSGTPGVPDPESRDNMLSLMVGRFLAWPLPETVCSDVCATKRGYPHRSGTNLLDAIEARQMLEHVAGPYLRSTKPPQVPAGKTPLASDVAEDKRANSHAIMLGSWTMQGKVEAWIDSDGDLGFLDDHGYSIIMHASQIPVLAKWIASFSKSVTPVAGKTPGQQLYDALCTVLRGQLFAFGMPYASFRPEIKDQLEAAANAVRSMPETGQARYEGKSSWEFACAWYGEDEIAQSIKRGILSRTPGCTEVPADTSSPEFAKWLTHQYRLAMNKGIQIAESSRRSMPGEPRPRIVCLCGSGRFREAFEQAEFDETLAGRIVLTIGCNTKDIARTPDLEHHKPMLDELHKRKIDLADYVLVLNVKGYIGQSTRSEIEYAHAHGKPVRYLEPPHPEPPPEQPATKGATP